MFLQLIFTTTLAVPVEWQLCVDTYSWEVLVAIYDLINLFLKNCLNVMLLNHKEIFFCNAYLINFPIILYANYVVHYRRMKYFYLITNYCSGKIYIL